MINPCAIADKKIQHIIEQLTQVIGRFRNMKCYRLSKQHHAKERCIQQQHKNYRGMIGAEDADQGRYCVLRYAYCVRSAYCDLRCAICAAQYANRKTLSRRKANLHELQKIFLE